MGLDSFGVCGGDCCLWWRTDLTMRERRRCLWRGGDLTMTIKGRRSGDYERKKKKKKKRKDNKLC